MLSVLIRRVCSNKFVKVFSLNLSVVATKLITGFITIKLVAILLGPTGVAIMGQINNLMNILLPLASGGILYGITKYVSQHRTNKLKLDDYLRTGFQLVLGCSIITMLLLALFPKFVSQTIFTSDQYYLQILLLAINISFFAFNNLQLSVLSGMQQFRLHSIFSIINVVVGFFITALLTFLFGINGLLTSIVSYHCIVSLLLFLLYRNKGVSFPQGIVSKVSPLFFKQYLNFSLMSLTSVIVAPILQLRLRLILITKFSLDTAGIWEGLNRLSSIYLMAFMYFFTIFYLPRLAEIKDTSEIDKEVNKTYKFILPIIIIGFSILFIFRRFIVKVIFSNDFYSMEFLLPWQLAGDFLRICTWVIYFIFLAKAKTTYFVVTEVMIYTLSFLFSILLLDSQGIIGVVQGYFYSQLFVFICIVALRKKIIRAVAN